MPSEGGGHVVIVGAGHAGGSLAAMLRQFGYPGPITLIGEEATAPYHRPPLSKAFLKDEVLAEDIKLRPDSFYHDNDIILRLGTHVDSLDVNARRLGFAGGGEAEYDILVLATGARARHLALPGSDLHNIHRLRTLDDAERLKSQIGPDRHVVIVGGGYVGLEVAASALQLGSRVTVIERESRVLARVASQPLSDFFAAYHSARGVEIVTNAQVEGFDGDDDDYVRAIRLGDGRSLACDAAIVGVGAQCCDQIARDAGIACEDGIVVDDCARTSAEGVFAIGDASWRPLPIYGGRMARLESVPNALEQAKQVASLLAGRAPPAPEVPWFWSDQFDVKLQIAGLPLDVDEIVVRGDPDAAKFAVFHFSGGRLSAVEAVNAPAEFMAGRQYIARGTPLDRAKLANMAISMKEVAS